MHVDRLRPLILLMASALLLSSCTRNASRLETSFVSTCAEGGTSKARCQCTYEAIHKHYGDKTMAEFNNGNPPADFANVLGTSMAQCLGKQ